MDKALQPLIDQLVKMIQGGADIVNGQLPDIAKQIIRLFVWGNVIEIPILLGIMVAGAFAMKWAYKKATADDWGEMPWIFLWIPISILELCIGNYAYGCGQAFLEALLAPKLMVIHQLRNLIGH